MAGYTEAHRQWLMEWYAPARVGVFYHWGLFTGGGCSGLPDWSPPWNQPFAYPTVEAFEAAAVDPEAIARNMVDTALYVGARYAIYTVFHTSEHYCPMYPSQVDGFVVHTHKDYNEDIPTCNQWWHRSPFITEKAMLEGPYVQDPTFMVKEMVSSLGQRGQWNYAHGLGPAIDGTQPAIFKPMLDNMHRFMAWAGQAIYRTTGGEGAPLQQGWTADGGFFSITVSLDDPNVLYLHVTTAPSRDRLVVQHYGRPVRSICDLRSGATLSFSYQGYLSIPGLEWTDVAAYGDKVLRVELADASSGSTP